MIERLRPTRLAGADVARAFTLLEVVAAIGVFAIGMVAVLALLTPVTRSIATTSDAEAAARVAEAVRARVAALSFEAAAALLQDPAAVAKNDADPAYNANDGAKHPAVLFGTNTGEIGLYNGTAPRKTWYVRDYTGAPPQPVNRAMTDGEKFFEIDLIRDTARTTDVLLAFTIRVRWPAFVPTSPTTAVQNGQNLAGGAVPFDQGKRQTLFFAGSILR